MKQRISAHQYIAQLAREEISDIEMNHALEVLQRAKVAIFIVAYNAEKHLEGLMKRIPPDLLKRFAEIFVIDDSSKDNTLKVAEQLKHNYAGIAFNAYRTPFNRGYGGNQKIGYLYCQQKKYDYVILLHGDAQYAPEYLPRVIAGFHEGADAVFASRMLSKKAALKGGMPLYKWVGNQILTFIENKALGTQLSEFHTGFRAYSVKALGNFSYVFNSDDFHFDTEIIIQAVATRMKIKEVAIPTYYGDEVCNVNGMKYAYNCIKAVLKYKLVNLGLYYQRNFDFSLFESNNYQFKQSGNSLHQYILNHAALTPSIETLELGCNRGILSSHIAQKVKRHVAVDIMSPDLAGKAEAKALDLNCDFSKQLGREEFDACVALDVVEHMNEPEKFLHEAFNTLKVNGKLYISTANIAYIVMRLSLLMGQFNYGKRGILDRTHHRLFTIRTMVKMLEQYGFHVEKVVGFAPPVTDMIDAGFVMKAVERIHYYLSRWFPKLFSFNFLVVARRMDDINDIFEKTVGKSPAVN